MVWGYDNIRVISEEDKKREVKQTYYIASAAWRRDANQNEEEENKDRRGKKG